MFKFAIYFVCVHRIWLWIFYMHSVYEAFQTYSHVRIDIIIRPTNIESCRTGKHYNILSNWARIKIIARDFAMFGVRKFLKRSKRKKNVQKKKEYQTSTMMKGVWVLTCVKKNSKVNIGRDQAAFILSEFKIKWFYQYCVCLCA